MACNVPIVSVGVGDVAERIGSTEGCYTTSRDPSDIASKVSLVINRTTRTNGREQVMALDERKVAREIVQVYKEVVSGKSERAQKP